MKKWSLDIRWNFVGDAFAHQCIDALACKWIDALGADALIR